MGASWSGDTGWYAIYGQALKATASDKVIYWNGASYGANQEAYFELSAIDLDGVEMGLALKVDASGGAIYSAIEVFYSQSGQNVQVWTYARGGQGWVQRGSYPVTLSSGDQLGAVASASGGVLLTTVDVSGWPYYQGGGYIGVWMVSAEDARLDDFGGGTLPTSLVPDRPRLAGLDLDGLKEWWDRAAGGVRAWWARLWGGGTFASLDVAQGELRLRPATMRQLNSPPAGEVWRKYYFAGSARIAMREVKEEGASDTLSYLLSDHLGSLSEVVTGASVSATQRYAAWGETRDAQGSPPTRFQFTGQYSEDYIKLYWIGSRWYDPELGRWIQPDMIVPEAVQGVQAWDRYAFVNNNSVNLTDPSGHTACWDEHANDPGCERYIPTGNGLIPATKPSNTLDYNGLDLIPVVSDVRRIIRGSQTMTWASDQQEFGSEQLALQGWYNNCYGECHYSDYIESGPSQSTLGGPMPPTPLVDTYSEGMGEVAGGAVSLLLDFAYAKNTTNLFAHGGSEWHVGWQTNSGWSIIHVGNAANPNWGGIHLALGSVGPRQSFFHIYVYPNPHLFINWPK